MKKGRNNNVKIIIMIINANLAHFQWYVDNQILEHLLMWFGLLWMTKV